MAKIPFDTSFERAGRPLSAWLVDLVADDPATRLTAGEWLGGMMHAQPSIHTDGDDLDWDNQPDGEQHRERFREAIRNAVRSPGFDVPTFVRRLIARRLSTKRSWCEFVAKKSSQPWNQHEALSFAAIAASTVFDSLDVDLLADSAGLRLMLADDQLRREACAALIRIGPPAHDLAPDLMAWLDEGCEYIYQNGESMALGSIGQDDPQIIDGLLQRLRSDLAGVRAGAAAALQAAGPSLAGRLELGLDQLFSATGDPDWEVQYAAISALAALGRDRSTVLDHILEFARPKPPRQRVKRYGDRERFYDEVSYQRGTAIDALASFEGFADRVVPVLIDAVDSFEEYNPDWSYEGEHGRVCAALESFGPNAAPAVPRLIGLLDDWIGAQPHNGEWPKDVCGVLQAIGPAASPALPTLRAVRAFYADPDDPESVKLDPESPLDRAILAIEGG